MAASKNAALKRKLLADADSIACTTAEFNFPICLNRIAKRQRVSRVDFSPLMVDAMLTTHSNGFRILLNSNGKNAIALRELYHAECADSLLPTRMRFSLAHELAHTFFFDRSRERPELEKSFRAGGRKTALEILEKHCNRIAAHLLLPTPMIKAWILKRRSFSPGTLLELSKLAGVSIEVLIYRLNEVRSVYMELPFYGCVVLLQTGSGPAQIQAVAKPKNMNIAVELGRLKSRSEWSLQSLDGSSLQAEDLLKISEIDLTHKTDLSTSVKKYRIEAEQINKPGKSSGILVVFQLI